MASRDRKIPPEVNRILFVKNLSFRVTGDELYELFGRYGSIRQIRLGTESNTRGTAYIVYEDVFDAKNACEKLNGYNFGDRYLVVLYHQPEKSGQAAPDLAARQAALEEAKRLYGIS